MANNTNTPSSARTVLIITRKQLIDQLKNQIERGKQVAEIPVASHVKHDDSGRTIRITYDKSQEEYFNTERRKWQQYVEELLKQSFSVSNNEYHKGFYESGQSLIFFPGQDYIQNERDEIADKVAYLESLIERLPIIPSSVEMSISPREQNAHSRPKKVFIVSGHDAAIRVEVELLVKKLGYEPIVLYKQASRGKTVIEILEDETDSVGFAIVLYTACDFGRGNNDSKEQPRARQNVLFEHGYLYARLGGDHVCALVEPGIEIPSDLAGVVYVSLTSSWELKVAKEMKQAGFEIDLNLI